MNPDPQHLVWIKPGTFTMGSPTNEVGRTDREGPQTLVTISKGFWMSKYETTQAEYESVMGTNQSFFRGATNRPVDVVTWNEATDYCGGLTARDRATGRLPAGYAYRLPTEAEWEYAARAGTRTRFSFGNDLPPSTWLGRQVRDSLPKWLGRYARHFLPARLGDYAWYNGNSLWISHPVGMKRPNRWGLYDMSGNAMEWCQDWYGTYPGGSVIDPVGPASGLFRVFRGGCVTAEGRHCRVAERSGKKPSDRMNGLGFRPVLAPGQP